MHRLLKRQLKRAYSPDFEPTGELAKLVAAVDAAYREFDDDRVMLERSLDLSSDELLKANSELYALFSTLPDLFIRVSRERQVLGVPGGVGDDPNVLPEADGRGSLDGLLVPAAYEAVVAGLGALANAPKGCTVSYQLTGDQELHFEARLIPLPEGEVIVVIRDATDSVLNARAEAARLEQAARVHAMEEFAYVASHDLRAPLRAMAQLSEWIAEDIEDASDETRENLDLLRRRVSRMDDLLVGLLDYSRVGRDHIEAEAVDLGDLVAGVVDMLDNHTFTFRVEALPVVKTARGPLERVFLNLVTNAVKHHDTGNGTIAIGCEREDKCLRLWVEDDGPGIPVGERENVFKMFKKLKSRDEVEGSGMGLALIKRIVEEVGGAISVHDGIDGGIRFTFTWPIDVDEGSPRRPSIATTAP